mmetsp:Transcript_112374/g.176861  ORF Transcript_112374/g.176861 Transcript_112374/m.176861 type:complete len:260 (-) Transcript_112374:87-866(-)
MFCAGNMCDSFYGNMANKTSFLDTKLAQQNACLLQQVGLLKLQNEQMEQHLKRMQLLAMIGPPPGLSQQSQLEAMMFSKAAVNESCDRSTCCCSSHRSTSPVPSDVSLDQVSDGHEDNRTTVTIRNLVRNCSRRMLLDFLDRLGFKGKYNLVYLPKDFQTGSNLGHAMVNLISGAQARRFRDQFDGFRDWVLSEQKVCEVSFCPTLQGLQAHIDRYKNSPVMHDSVPDDFKPILLVKGCRVAFPPPTRRIRAPRQCACC